MACVHLDTNAYRAFKEGSDDAQFILSRAERIVISVIVIGELRAGFAVGTRAVQNNRELLEFLGSPRVRVANITPDLTERYAAIYAQLRHDGQPIPTNDMWIAAVAKADEGAVLWSQDAHFRHIRGLRLARDAADFRRLAG